MEIDEDYRENAAGPVKGKGSKAKGQPLVTSSLQNGKSIEEMYQKKSQLEHILLRPDTYIGSTEKQQQLLWVHNEEKMELRNVSFVPGLYKIFDEILVNAADNKVRDASMDTVKVVIDKVNGSIQVWNNGSGVPVEVHKEEKVYVPEMIFGHLLTSSNYDDNEKKVTGGRNGYGAKLANIFSTEFTIETCDGSRQKRYKQVFTNNMNNKGAPKITDCKATDNWTCVTFKPDLAKFGMEELEEDTVALMNKRVYDLAGILGKGVKVFLNGERLNIKSFSDYVDLYLGPKETVARVYERISDRWEICVSTTDGQFNQVSFVNSICTMKGGTHVNYIVDQITKFITEKMNKKNKNANVKPFMVKNHVWVFLNCSIENPAFDSQTKENLTLRASSFGSKCELPAPFLEKVSKSGLAESILSYAEFRNNKELKKSDGTKRSRLTGIAKLDDANDAGGKNSSQCTLILTEGDSAKGTAVMGLGVVGRDHYGVFPLRGKLLNVREASAAQISANQEIQNLKQIMGLQHGKVYDDVKSLRYGHLMIMTDQDHDGSHIKGLLMNFLHTFYPSLLKIPGFLVEFITPIIKARHSDGRQVKTFYTMPEYETWLDSMGGAPRNWQIKYYKGLGTSTKQEAQDYFAALDKHRKEFIWEGEEDGQAIEMAFSKKKVDDRKHWLSAFVPGTFLDQSVSQISYSEFVNKELILFSRADLERSIPCMVDGLKPGQRKILFGAFKKKMRGDTKVADLAAYVSGNTAYHHGETSLNQTIVGLAQDFVGSNNINLLMPNGNFGTRLQGGKDAASARYIYTNIAPMARHLFNEADHVLLNYLSEEGQSIEPEWFMPIMPLVLINGAEGIGTGWSTSIPNYSPRDIVANLKRLLAGQEQETMHPWYRGFTGAITEVANKAGARSYAISGILKQIDDLNLEITELPIRKWTQDYKEMLEGMLKPENKDEAPLIEDYREHHSDGNVHFQVELVQAKVAEVMAAGLDVKFKMTTKISTSNMMLFDKDGLIKHYQSPEHIMQDFFDLRLEYYERRRQAMLKAARFESQCISNKVRFILAVVSNDLKVSNRKKAEIRADLERQGFDKLPSKGKAASEDADDEEAEEGRDTAPGAGSYEYLLRMPISSLTTERIAALRAAAEQLAQTVAGLEAASPGAMWEQDLDAFLEAYEAWEAEEAERALKAAVTAKNAQKGRAGKAKGKPAAKAKPKKKAMGSDDEEMDDANNFDDMSDDDFELEQKKPAPKKAAPKPAAAPAPAATAPAAAKPAPAPKAAIATAKAGPLAAAAKKPAAAKAAPAPVPAPVPSTSEVTEESDLGLFARLTGRFGKLTVEPTATTTAAPSAAGPSAAGPSAAAPRAAKKPAVVDLMSEDSDNEADSPVPAPPKARAAPKASKLGPAAAAAAPPKPAAAAKAPAAAAKAMAGADAKPAKRKQVVARGKKILDSDDEDEESPASSSGDDDDFEMEPPSPAVAPKGKKSKVGPSPLHMKAMSRLGMGAAKAPAAIAAAPARVPAVTIQSGSEEEEEEAPKPQRARRAAAVTKKKDYIEISDSDGDDASASGDDSDFVEDSD